MNTSAPAAIVDTWHAALRAGDADALADVTDDRVELVGPRGSAVGLAVVQDWVIRSGIRLDPVRVVSRDAQVVVEQVARWRDPETGGWTDPSRLATAFTVADGKITRIARYADFPAALAANSLIDAAGAAGLD